MVTLTQSMDYDLHLLKSTQTELSKHPQLKKFYVVNVDPLEDLGQDLWWREFEQQRPGEFESYICLNLT